MKLTINPEYEALVPNISDEEYNALYKSIDESGLWVPIIVNPEGAILDGHHRYKICNKLGITIKHVERVFENKLLEKKFVIECNLKRRQLNDFQKAELGIPLLEIERQLAEKRQLDAGNSIPLASDDTKGRSPEIVAKTIGVSGNRRTVIGHQMAGKHSHADWVSRAAAREGWKIFGETGSAIKLRDILTTR